jgi:hypothetical protein
MYIPFPSALLFLAVLSSNKKSSTTAFQPQHISYTRLTTLRDQGGRSHDSLPSRVAVLETTTQATLATLATLTRLEDKIDAGFKKLDYLILLVCVFACMSFMMNAPALTTALVELFARSSEILYEMIASPM